MALTIRPLYALSDMYPAVELQKTYWGDDAESIIPAHMLFSLANHGGHVLAAFDGEWIGGVLVGFLGAGYESQQPPAANLQIVSKRMVVLPEYRNQGLAFRLKLAQRDRAMEQGIELVTWTFDPLLAPNAHLNIRKLGAVCPTYRENYYGTEGSGGLSVLGASDRLFIEWWVMRQRVKERLEGLHIDLTLQEYLDSGAQVVNPATLSRGGLPQPALNSLSVVGATALLEIPVDYRVIVNSDEVLAQDWRLHIREQMQLLLRAGYVVTDFLRSSHEGRDRVFYVLSRRDPKFDFSQN